VWRHYHVSEAYADGGPEIESRLATDPDSALEVTGDLLTGWAEAHDNDEDGDQEEATAASGTAEMYRPASSSPEHADLLAQLDRHGQVAEYVGNRVIQARVCQDQTCLKYCPTGDCATFTEVGDPDTRCWCCGARYVGSDACPWLDR
jgi:hypothetical protein